MRLLLILAALLAAFPALAQTNTTPLPPFVRPATVGTSPVLVAPQNDARRSIEFCNPNVTAVIAVCPVRSRVDASAITCAVNGAGSVTIPPSNCWGKTIVTQSATLPTAWNAIADTAASKITVFETE
jgi:hypothetical protein